MRRKFSQLMIFFTTGQEEEFLNGEIEVNSDFIIIYKNEGQVDFGENGIKGIEEIEVEYVINLKLVNMFKLIK